jgi:hypothetical protein
MVYHAGPVTKLYVIVMVEYPEPKDPKIASCDVEDVVVHKLPSPSQHVKPFVAVSSLHTPLVSRLWILSASVSNRHIRATFTPSVDKSCS